MIPRAALYSAVDDTLTVYALEPDTARLTRRAQFRMHAKVQYAWPHPSRPVLYVSTASGGPHVVSERNHVTAYAVSRDGGLTQLGRPAPLDRRATHASVDPSGRYVLNVHNFPAGGVSVHAIEPDGAVGRAIAQDPGLAFGIYPHQVRSFPSGRTILVADRGFSANAERGERPGALRTFRFEDGHLAPGQVVAPNGGFGFGPRHVDFHPTRPWIYVCDERHNKLRVFRHAGDRIEPEAACVRDTLAEPGRARPRQLASAIHVHPGGRWVYVANRSDYTIEVDGRKVHGGGENSIAVFAIDPGSGEATLLQHAPTHSFHVRTFAFDPGARMLVAASIKPHAALRDGGAVAVPASLAVFRIGADGRLDFLRTHDVDATETRLQYWIGIVRLPD